MPLTDRHIAELEAATGLIFSGLLLADVPILATREQVKARRNGAELLKAHRSRARARCKRLARARQQAEQRAAAAD